LHQNFADPHGCENIQCDSPWAKIGAQNSNIQYQVGRTIPSSWIHCNSLTAVCTECLWRHPYLQILCLLQVMMPIWTAHIPKPHLCYTALSPGLHLLLYLVLHPATANITQTSALLDLVSNHCREAVQHTRNMQISAPKKTPRQSVPHLFPWE
jgi:hypothetical protein